MPRAARPPHARRVHRPAIPGLRGRTGNAPARCGGPPRRFEERAGHRVVQHHEMLHEGVPGKHHHYRQRDYSPEGTCRGSFLRSALKTVPHFQSEWTIGGFYANRLKTYLSGKYSGGDRKSGTLPPSERTQSCGKHLLGHFDGSPWAPTSLDFAVAGANSSVRDPNESADASRSSFPHQRPLPAPPLSSN